MSKSSALVFASSGNVLAIVVNYFLGLFLYEKTKAKLEKSRVGKRGLSFGHRYGYYGLILSWLPIIGDPLTLVAGVVRLNFVLFVLIAGSMRILRYYFIAELF